MADQPHWYIVTLSRVLGPSCRATEVGHFRVYAWNRCEAYCIVMNQEETHNLWDAYIDPLALERSGQIGEFEKVEQADVASLMPARARRNDAANIRNRPDHYASYICHRLSALRT